MMSVGACAIVVAVHNTTDTAAAAAREPRRAIANIADTPVLGNIDVPAVDRRAVATGSRLDANLLAPDVDRGAWVHLDRSLGAIDFDDHRVAGIFAVGGEAVVEAVETGFVPGLEDRLPMISAGADSSDRNLNADGIAGRRIAGRASGTLCFCFAMQSALRDAVPGTFALEVVARKLSTPPPLFGNLPRLQFREESK